MSEPADPESEPSAPPAELVFSPVEYAELYSMASARGEDVEEGLKRTKKALKLKAHAKRLKAAMQQRVEREVAAAQTQRWRWRSPGGDVELEKQLQDLQGLIDDISSAASVEDGVWRYRKIWEPKLRFVEEDMERGVPEEDIAEKYDLYEAVSEAIQYRQSVKLLREIGEELKKAEASLLQIQAQNESQSLRLLSFFDILEARIESAVKLEEKSSRLRRQAQECEAAAAAVRGDASGVRGLSSSAGKESRQPFLPEAQEAAESLWRQAEEAKKDFEMIQKGNQEATLFLNSQLRAYEEAQRSCGLLGGTLQDLRQALLEHKEEPPLPGILEPQRELLRRVHSSLQRCFFKARGIEAFEIEQQLRRCQEEDELAETLGLASCLKDVDPVLMEEKHRLLKELTEKRLEERRCNEALERTRCQQQQEVRERRESWRRMRSSCGRLCCAPVLILIVTAPLTIGTLAGVQLNIRWLRNPPSLDSKELWAGFCKAELSLTGVASFLVLVFACLLCGAVPVPCGPCSVPCLLMTVTFWIGLLPGFDAWSSDAPSQWSWMRVVSSCVYLAFFGVVWLLGCRCATSWACQMSSQS